MDILKIRKDFPILKRKVNGHPLVYLDNAATSQKPKQVIEAIADYYRSHNANVHRGIHTLSVEATEAYEAARAKIARFVGVRDTSEIIFVRNATEAINLVSYAWGRLNINKEDEIVMTVAEHHSNFVVWQQIALENGAVLKIVSVDENGEVDLIALKKALTKKTKLVTFFHVSNVLGTINPVGDLVKIVRHLKSDIRILVDGAQAVPHMPVNIPKLGCDFYVFTGHKMLGPTGIGVLWVKRKLLKTMPPFLFGGEMISKVSSHESSWNEIPWKFEAGTPDVAGAVGLAAAVDYLMAVGMENVRRHEVELTKCALERLSKIPEVVIYGPRDQERRGGVVSFNIGDPSTSPAPSGARASSGPAVHAHDVASILDSEGIAIRSGHHCAQPLMEFLGIASAARASFYLYNSEKEIDRLVEGIEKVKKTFKK